MLLVDIAKATGFKDSFSFLIKNHDFPRLVATEADREKLIELDLIPYQLKNRTIGLVTARSIFRRFGYKIIKRGRSIRDDYLVGDREEPPEVDESLKKGLDLTKALTLELKREVAAEIYTNFPYRKTDVGNRNTDDLPEFEAPTGLTLDNWMYRATLSAAEFNRKLNMTRPKLFWDPHTNIEHVPQISQPTVTRLEMSRGPQDPAFGHVVNDVNVDGLDLENWEPVVQTEKSRKYPIALVAGQRQYAFAV